MPLSTSNFAEDRFRLQNFRHGEAPWQERVQDTRVITLEVERNRNETTPSLLKFPGHQYLFSTFLMTWPALVSLSKPDSLHGLSESDPKAFLFQR
jgi:hypothetical protein